MNFPGSIDGWTPELDSAAAAEGWSLFATGRAPGVEAQAFDMDERPLVGWLPGGDEEAWTLIRAGVAAGSPHHVTALAILDREAPEEAANVRQKI